MAHFAQLDDTNVVINVIVVDNRDTTDTDGNEVEALGVAFCKKLFGADTNWKQTSYNGRIRGRYAGVGMTYDAELDKFLHPRPFPSWVLTTDAHVWTPPIPEPALTEEELAAFKYYRWDEDAYQADNSTGWVLHDPE